MVLFVAVYMSDFQGSVHNRKINYDPDECFFIKSDIPIKARLVHDDIKRLVNPDYLG